METPTPSRTKSTIATAIVVVLVTFFAGFVAGGAADRVYLFRTHQLLPRRMVDAGARHIVARLDHELSLTPEQRTQVEQIVERGRARMDAVMSNVRPQMRQQIDATNAEIEKILTPEQRTKFAAMKMHMRHGERDRRRGGPPGPPF